MSATVAERARENVGVDRSLTPSERETTFRLAADQDRVAVFSEERGVMRRLLVHPESEINYVRVSHEHASGTPTPLEAYERGRVVAVSGSLPVGCLSVRAEPRQATGHAEIVTRRVLENGGGETA